MDGEGHVVVADCYNNRIQVFTKDGKYVMKFGDSGQGKLDHPLGCIHSRPQSHSVSRTITSGSGCSQKFEFFHWLMKLNAH